MTRARALAVAALIALGGPAQGQDAEAALGLVETCLGAAEGRADELGCFGRYAAECMATSEGGDTTVGMTACTMAESEAWDRVLNEAYAELVVLARRRAAIDDEAGSPSPPLEAMLRDAQRAWIAFRDADCEQEYAIWGEGSMRQIAGAACLADRTATRAVELRAKRRQMAVD